MYFNCDVYFLSHFKFHKCTCIILISMEPSVLKNWIVIHIMMPRNLNQYCMITVALKVKNKFLKGLACNLRACRFL
jgi:hypothetical protein